MPAQPAFYAVRIGKIPGIYKDWSTCKMQIYGYRNAEYKKFDNLKDAENFLTPKEVKAKRGYSLYTDGGSRKNPGIAGCAAILYKENKMIASSFRYLGNPITNNVAEYHSLILGLNIALNEEVEELLAFSDSKLVVFQMLDKWKILQPDLIILNEIAKNLAKKFKNFEIQHIPREINLDADKLANQAMDLGNQF